MPGYSNINFDITYSSDKTLRPIDFENDGKYAIAAPRGSKPKYFKILDEISGRYEGSDRVCCFKYTLGMKLVEYEKNLHALNISLNKSGSKIIFKLYSMTGELKKEISKSVGFTGKKRHVLFSQDETRDFAYLLFNNTLYEFNVEQFSLKENEVVGYSINKHPGYLKVDLESSRFALSNPNNHELKICQISSPSDCVRIKHSSKNTIRNVAFYKNYIFLGQGKNGVESFNAETGELVLNYGTGYLPESHGVLAIGKNDVLLLGTKAGIYVYRLSSGEELDFVDIQKTSAGNYPDLKLIRYVSVNDDLFAVWENGSVVKIDYIDKN